MRDRGITLVGAGALGQALAAYLASSGPTTLLARGATLDRLERLGHLAVTGPGLAGATPIGTGSGEVRLVDDATELDPSEAVLFTTKGPALADAAGSVARVWQPTTGLVAGLQNGVAKDEVLAGAFGAAAVVGAATVLGARRADGQVLVTGIGPLYAGEFGAAGSPRVDELVRRCTAAGLPGTAVPDIAALLWTKCVNAVAAFGVSSLTRLASSNMMRREPLVVAFLDLLAEASAIAAAAGHPVADFPDLPVATYLSRPVAEVAPELLARIRATALPARPGYSSMAMDVIAGRPTEVEQVFGDLVRRAGDLGVDAPLLAFTRRIIAGLEAPES